MTDTTPIRVLFEYLGCDEDEDRDVWALLKPLRIMQNLRNTVELWEGSKREKAANLQRDLGFSLTDAHSVMAFLQDHGLLRS